jgi:predicted alpha/beta-fold hydrolase
MVLLLLPGILNSKDNSYITHFVDEARKKNSISVIMHYRGIDTSLLTPRLYSTVDYEDIELVVSHIRSQCPKCCLVATGVSFGKDLGHSLSADVFFFDF